MWNFLREVGLKENSLLGDETNSAHSLPSGTPLSQLHEHPSAKYYLWVFAEDRIFQLASETDRLLERRNPGNSPEPSRSPATPQGFGSESSSSSGSGLIVVAQEEPQPSPADPTIAMHNDRRERDDEAEGGSESEEDQRVASALPDRDYGRDPGAVLGDDLMTLRRGGSMKPAWVLLISILASGVTIALIYPLKLISESVWKCTNPHFLSYLFDIIFPNGYLSFKVTLSMGVPAISLYLAFLALCWLFGCGPLVMWVVIVEVLGKFLVAITFLPLSSLYVVLLANKSASLAKDINDEIHRTNNTVRVNLVINRQTLSRAHPHTSTNSSICESNPPPGEGTSLGSDENFSSESSRSDSHGGVQHHRRRKVHSTSPETQAVLPRDGSHQRRNKLPYSAEIWPFGTMLVTGITLVLLTPCLVFGWGIKMLANVPYLSYTPLISGSFMLGGGGIALLLVICSTLWHPRKWPLYSPLPEKFPHTLLKIFYLCLCIFGVVCVISIIFGGLIHIYESAPATQPATDNTYIRIVQFNIRYPASYDDLGNQWDSRKQDFVDFVESLHPDILTVQEAYIWPLWYILDNLFNGTFKWTGKGRNDGVHAGEHAAIFFNASRFSVEDGDTFWLSPTPLLPSVFLNEDMSNFRECTWVRLREKSTKYEFLAITTHYGWGDNFDTNAANLIIKETASHVGQSLPVILTGDLNANITSPGYHTLVTNTAVPLCDAMLCCQQNCTPTNCTQSLSWTSEPYCPADAGDQRIDFIFTSIGVPVVYYDSPRTTRASTNTTFSDHFPVVVDVILPAGFVSNSTDS
ncbi:Endonuclease/Exonuclease/phosphatase family protein [Pelomyxa schiedti]|nr:Endonuclease/Exonuclease/phosphatase family protein [Pelomyxa schiedti]